MHGFERIHIGGMRGVHFVNVCRTESACAGMISGGVAVFDPEILYFQAAYRGRHPAILIAMIVDAAELPDFPADGHTFEYVILKNQVARVAAFREEKILLQCFRPDRVAEDVILNAFQGEIPFGDGGEVFDPVGNGKLLGGELSGHRKPPANYNSSDGSAI